MATFGTAYPYKMFYVCNYGPTGNWISLPVYLQGTARIRLPRSQYLKGLSWT
ncbi:hypothetical protein DAPPUDRAFT_312471 [Daphnia pulex]|uniref:SCP domain-containing protein n=1 Tax=Daphnia pulex TaxID=6669 RepID=E9G0Y5_DAPPU|nr:hypothetical protein DAPPUDRAFT_312471 [Daphnia pulex]|eukprot:EFX86986.1 hypothetical protein DAPPUDRAFT_312471 [Daphnia pulex]